MRSTFIAGVVVVLAASTAAAQEVTLRAVSSFAEGTEFSKNFERFIEKVNADGKGVIKINYIGGPRAVPPFEVGNAVRTRVVDIANVTGAFYTNLMPEADGFKLNGKPMSEQRQNGTWEYINQLHNQKLNSYYLARQFHNVPFHIYLNKKIDKIDFSGLKSGSRRSTATWSRRSAAPPSPPRRARSIPRSSAASPTAMAGRSPAFSISAGTR